MNRVPDPNQLVPPHLQDSELLAHLDGELSRAERDRVGSHLESCWDCRSRQTTLQASIEKLIEFRKTLRLPAAYGTEEMRREQFRSRLERHAQESATQVSWWTDIRGSVTGAFSAPAAWLTRYRQPGLAIVVAACLLVTMFTDVWTTRVSAETVLARAQDYETSHQPTAGMVLRSSLRIDRIEPKGDRTRQLERLTVLRESSVGPAVVEVDSFPPLPPVVLDAATSADRLPRALAVTPGFSLPVLQFLAAAHWIPDLAPAEFRKILESRGAETNSARKVGGLFELHYPFAPNHVSTIGEAIFVVDARDYAPVRMSLMTTEGGNAVEYRFTRAEYGVEPRTQQLAMLLSASDAIARPKSETPQRTAPRVVPLTYLNSTATDAEVAVVRALHGTDACLGEEVHVFPMSDGSLLVQGLVDSPQRREAVRHALRSISAPLALEIYLPRELKSGTQLLNPPDRLPGQNAGEERAIPVTTLADLSSQRIPLHDVLYRHFSSQGTSNDETERQVNAFSNEVVTLTRQTFLHAWALKRLDREFSQARVAGLSPESVREINQMREDHRRWIVTNSHRQAQTLGAIVDSSAIDSLNAADASRLDTDTLLRLAREQSDLVRALFTTSSSAAQPSASVNRLLAVLKQLGA